LKAFLLKYILYLNNYKFINLKIYKGSYYKKLKLVLVSPNKNYILTNNVL